MSFSSIIFQNKWSICKVGHQFPIWFVFNLSELLKEGLICGQKNAVFSPFLKEEFKALRVGVPLLPRDKQMLLREGTCLQGRLWFPKPSIVSELCVRPVGADSSENQTGDWPVSLETPAVKHNRESRRPWFKEPGNGNGPAGLPGSTPHLAGGELSPERTSDLSKFAQPDRADLEQTAWLLSPWRCMAPRQARLSLRQISMLVLALECLTLKSENLLLQPWWGN